VLLLSQAVGLTLVAAAVLIAGDPLPSSGALAEAAVAGLAAVVALAAFYRGLAIGTMSIVAPISATGAAVPVIVGLARGSAPGRSRWPQSVGSTRQPTSSSSSPAPVGC
jgi:hypothetical protein